MYILPAQINVKHTNYPMKKILVTLLFTSALLGIEKANAQEIGIRFGDALGNKNSAAIDAIFSLGKFSRVHADVSFGDGLGIELLANFLYKPLGGEAGMYWYVGAGPALFLGDPFLFGISGEIGLEYRFSIPLVLGADFRPTFRIIENTGFDSGFGVNVRYVIGSQ